MKKSCGLDWKAGYTAIASLHRFPVDRIKIDRSLVAGVDKDHDLMILTDAVVSLGRRLGLRVLAEGIETEEEYRCLLDMGATCVQGFKFARPMSSSDCLSWLSGCTQQTIEPKSPSSSAF